MVDPGPMNGQQEGIRFLGGLARRTGACIALGVARQFLQFVLTARVAEYDFMSSSREDRSELAAHQSRTQNANSHATLPSIACLPGGVGVSKVTRPQRHHLRYCPPLTSSIHS